MIFVEYRKIIKFGKSAHVVSLPTSWIRKNNLNKGDTIYFEENGRNELIFSPKDIAIKDDIPAIIDLQNKSEAEIYREVSSAYINNHHTIIFKSNNISAEKSNELRRVIHSHLALEIIEQSTSKIVAKDFLNMKELSPRTLIRDIDTAVKVMFEDSRDTYKKNLVDSLLQRDEAVNSLHFLTWRTVLFNLKNPNVAKALNFDTSELLKHWLISDYLEEIADECKRVARYFSQVQISKKSLSEFLNLYTKIYDTYNESMKAFYKNDKDLAFKLTLKKVELLNECSDYLNRHYTIPHIPQLMERVRIMINQVHLLVKLNYIMT